MSSTCIGHPLFSASKNNTSLAERCQREINIQLTPDLNISLFTVVDDTLDSGGSIWNGGYYLSKYLLQHVDIVQHKSVLEIGSGCGLTGIVAGVCEASSIVLTDLSEQIPYLQCNVNKNSHLLQSVPCTVAALEWGSETKCEDIPPSYDVILAADVGFDVSLHEPLVTTLRLYATVSTDIYLVEELRWKDVYDWYQEALMEHFELIETVVISNDDCRVPVILKHVRKK